MRRGFTMIELLVVLGIVGIVMALLLPAIAASRDAALRTQCLSRLAQIGIACANYQSGHGVFPSSGAYLAFQGVVPSAHFQLLPFLDSKNLFESTNAALMGQFGASWTPQWGIANETIGRQRVAAFLCPAEASYPGATNYLACTGIWFYWGTRNGQRTLIADRLVGSFYSLKWRRPGDFVRGTSRTVAFGERPTGDGESAWLDRRVDVIGGIAPWPLPEETIPEVCRRFDRLAGTWAPHYSHVGRNWLFPGAGLTGYTHAMTPNSPVTDCALIIPEMSGAITARSRHTSGVNVVYFDGHCETVGPAIDAELWFRQSLVSDPNE